VQHRPHQAFDPVRPGRLDAQSAAAFQDLGVEMVGVLIMRGTCAASQATRASQRCTRFTPRRVQQIVQAYRDRAGIAQHVHPHLFRHQMLTFLTSQGLSDAQIQLISGHESKRSLEIYQHLSLDSVEEAYQEAVQSLRL
jgi:site-specific recombinase XerD